MRNGTTIIFKPSQDVYRLETIKVNIEEIKEMCKNWSYLNKGLFFQVFDRNNSENFSYLSKKGILDLLNDNIKKPVNNTPIHYEIEQNGVMLEVAYQWTHEKEKSFVFTNGLHNIAGGTTLTGAKTAITRTLNLLTKKKFNGDMARTGLFYVMSAKIPNASFSDQTKTKVNNPELRALSDKAFTESLKFLHDSNPKEWKKIEDFLTKEEKAEIAAEKARQAILNNQKEITQSRKQKAFMLDKLKDAEQLGENSTLLLVEGKSAAGSMIQSRDTNKFGVLALRGKIINALSNPIEDILENEEVKTFLKALGVSINNYDSKKLRYGKVAICVDSDEDGSHIACLIMALIQKLIPEFLQENRLYWLKAPLYKVTKGKDNFYYYSDEELTKGKKGSIIRYKGLGQMNAEDVEESMFHNQYQRMEQLLYSHEGIELLLNLMGEQVEPRKDFVFNEIDFSQYGEL